MSVENSNRIPRRELLIKIAQNSPFLFFAGLAVGDAANAVRAGRYVRKIDGKIDVLRNSPTEPMSSESKPYVIHDKTTEPQADFSEDLNKIHQLEGDREVMVTAYDRSANSMVTRGAVAITIAEFRSILQI